MDFLLCKQLHLQLHILFVVLKRLRQRLDSEHPIISKWTSERLGLTLEIGALSIPGLLMGVIVMARYWGLGA